MQEALFVSDFEHLRVQLFADPKACNADQIIKQRFNRRHQALLLGLD